MGGDAVGQRQEALEPIVLGGAELLDVGPGLGAADDGTQGNQEDVTQEVFLGPVDAGVGQVGEVVGERQRGGLQSGSSEGDRGPATDTRAVQRWMRRLTHCSRTS